VSEDLWYEELRARYQPAAIRVVFVGESAPDPRGASRRFFYSPQLTYDNLFRGLMAALYDAGSDVLDSRKPEWLERFCADGFWLLDVVDRPVNKLPTGQRSRARREAAAGAIDRIAAARPTVGVVVCHGPTFTDLERSGASGRLTLLHTEPIPFPLGNFRAEFIRRVRLAMNDAGIRVPG
jgi:hypothetical protein